MRLTRIALSDFLGYTTLELDLSGINRLVVVGDNGSGKSTLLDAVSWALYDHVQRPEVRTDDELIHTGADRMSVRVEFDSSGKHVAVVREKVVGRTGSLSLEVDGANATRATIRETRAEIARLVGLPLDALLAGPIMAQRNSDALMRALPSERKQMLAKVFDLDRFDAYYERAKAAAAAHEADRVSAVDRVERLSETLRSEADIRARHEELRETFEVSVEAERLAQDRIAHARAALARLGEVRSRHEALTERTRLLTARIDAARANKDDTARRLASIPLTMARPVVPPPPESHEDEVRQRLTEAKRAATLAASEANALSTWQLRVDTAERAAQTVQTVPCGGVGEYASCRFLVDAVEASKSLPRLRSERDHARSRVTFAEHAAANVAVIETELERVVRASADHRAALAEQEAWDSRSALVDQLRATLDTSDATIRESVAERDAVTEEQAGQAESLKQLAAVQTELSDAEQARSLAQRRHDELRGPLQALTSQIAVIEQARAEIDAERERAKQAETHAATYRTLMRAFHRDGIPTLVLENGFAGIEDAANEVLNRLPGQMSVALRTQRQTKTGAMADTLDVMVSVGGWDRAYGLLSVGQRFRIDLALRIALGRVLARRAGTRIETLWLDEPLADLDAGARSAVIETLAALGEDFDLMVVVSHHPDFNDQFANQLEVTMVADESHAVLVA